MQMVANDCVRIEPPGRRRWSEQHDTLGITIDGSLVAAAAGLGDPNYCRPPAVALLKRTSACSITSSSAAPHQYGAAAARSASTADVRGGYDPDPPPVFSRTLRARSSTTRRACPPSVEAPADWWRMSFSFWFDGSGFGFGFGWMTSGARVHMRLHPPDAAFSRTCPNERSRRRSSSGRARGPC